MDDRIDDDLPLTSVPRAGWAGLLQRFRRVEPVPEPFRESDFEHSEWRSSALDAQPGRAE